MKHNIREHIDQKPSGNATSHVKPLTMFSRASPYSFDSTPHISSFLPHANHAKGKRYRRHSIQWHRLLRNELTDRVASYTTLPGYLTRASYRSEGSCHPLSFRFHSLSLIKTQLSP